MDFEQIIDDANAAIEARVSGMRRVDAEELGLDGRANTQRMWVCGDGIVTEGDTRNLRYYGGFEYVKKRHVTVIGDYTFWSSESERICGHVRRVLPDEIANRFGLEDEDED